MNEFFDMIKDGIRIHIISGLERLVERGIQFNPQISWNTPINIQSQHIPINIDSPRIDVSKQVVEIQSPAVNVDKIPVHIDQPQIMIERVPLKIEKDAFAISPQINI